jgi:hypothetical protein
LQKYIRQEIARAQAIVNAGSKKHKLHEPTIENHRGQLLAYRKIDAMIEGDKIVHREPIKIQKNIRITITWPIIILSIIIICFAYLF